MSKIFENSAISWKKRIKYMQIFSLLLILVGYFVFSYTKGLYEEYTVKKQELEKAKDSYIKSYNQFTQINIDINTFSKIYSISDHFINAYNACFTKHIQKQYGITKSDFVDLKTCIDRKIKKRLKGYNGFISGLDNKLLERVAIMFGIMDSNVDKMDFDNKKFLYSLDKNIFNNSLEKKVDILTLSKPVLLDKKRKFYKVNFSFRALLSYSEFQNVLRKMQNIIYKKNNIYYTIDNISNYDITGDMGGQSVNIQGSFYFTKK